MVYLSEIIFVARTTLIGQPVPGLLRPFRHKQGLPIIIELKKEKSWKSVYIFIYWIQFFNVAIFVWNLNANFYINTFFPCRQSPFPIVTKKWILIKEHNREIILEFRCHKVSLTGNKLWVKNRKMARRCHCYGSWFKPFSYKLKYLKKEDEKITNFLTIRQYLCIYIFIYLLN